MAERQPPADLGRDAAMVTVRWVRRRRRRGGHGGSSAARNRRRRRPRDRPREEYRRRFTTGAPVVKVSFGVELRR
jgi:hypothetical protein